MRATKAKPKNVGSPHFFCSTNHNMCVSWQTHSLVRGGQHSWVLLQSAVGFVFLFGKLTLGQARLRCGSSAVGSNYLLEVFGILAFAPRSIGPSVEVGKGPSKQHFLKLIFLWFPFKPGFWNQGVYSHFCDTRESPPVYGLLVFGNPFLLYHRSGHFPQPCFKPIPKENGTLENRRAAQMGFCPFGLVLGETRVLPTNSQTKGVQNADKTHARKLTCLFFGFLSTNGASSSFCGRMTCSFGQEHRCVCTLTCRLPGIFRKKHPRKEEKGEPLLEELARMEEAEADGERAVAEHRS